MLGHNLAGAQRSLWVFIFGNHTLQQGKILTHEGNHCGVHEDKKKCRLLAEARADSAPRDQENASRIHLLNVNLVAGKPYWGPEAYHKLVRLHL